MKGLIFIGIFILFLPFIISCGKEKKILKPAPDFTLRTVEGKRLTLSEFKGKVIILNFFATWCPPCRMEIPDFIELYNRYHKQGLEIIGVSLDEDKEELLSFVKELKINYPVVLAGKERNKIVKDYGGIRGIPTTFIIDQKMHIRSRYIGYRPIEVFEKEIKGLLPP